MQTGYTLTSYGFFLLNWVYSINSFKTIIHFPKALNLNRFIAQTQAVHLQLAAGSPRPLHGKGSHFFFLFFLFFFYLHMEKALAACMGK